MTLLIGAGLAGPKAGGDVAFVGATSPYIGSTLSATHTFAYTAATSGSGRKGICIVGYEDDTADKITGITYNGVSLTKGIDRTDTGGIPDNQIEIWYLDTLPTDGSSHNVVVTLSATERPIALFLEWKNVASGAPAATGTGASSSTSTINFTSVPAGALLIDAVVTWTATVTFSPGSGQTERMDSQEATGGLTCACSTKVSVGGSDSMAQTVSDVISFAHCAARWNKAA